MLEVLKVAKAKRFDRIRGALYGVAVGDCLGAPAEFRHPAEVKALFGQIRDIVPGSIIGARLGCGTDDTAMTLAVAEGIMSCDPGESPIEPVGAEFVRWYNGEPVGLGGTCGSAIEIASSGGLVEMPTARAWLSASEVTHMRLHGRSGGNGTLMRTAPVALFYVDDDTRDKVAYDLSKMMHCDEDAAKACVIYCRILSRLIRGRELIPSLSRETVGTVYKTALRTDMDFTPCPSGYVVDSFNTALWALRRGRTFEDTLIAVVNLGGDADTIGAIAGGIAGAAYGYSAIPDRWIQALNAGLKEHLDGIAEAAGKVWDCST